MNNKTCPNYLKEYKDIWDKDAHLANMKWWENAKFGMMIHYGLYSFMDTIGHINEWAQFYNKVPLSEYEKVKDVFTAHNFDADKITDLALNTGMSYINLVTCHHDGFCLWDSKTEPFNAVNSACKRDLVRELADACDKKGLGFFTYYTFAQNWRHPYFVDNDVYHSSRPHYDIRPKEYLYQKPQDLLIYVDYIEKCMKELLTDCGVTAGIWLDLIMAYYPLKRHGYFDVEKIYQNIRKLRPDALLSWKQGATGTEDFATPEQHFHSLENNIRHMFGDEAAEHHHMVWNKNRKKHNEICATLQPGSWGFSCYAEHRKAEECYDLLAHAMNNNANLCLNIGPLSDGSISPIQENILKELGDIISKKGYPKANNQSPENYAVTGLNIE